jgi:hypothetical protein
VCVCVCVCDVSSTPSWNTKRMTYRNNEVSASCKTLNLCASRLRTVLARAVLVERTLRWRSLEHNLLYCLGQIYRVLAHKFLDHEYLNKHVQLFILFVHANLQYTGIHD